jgi:hypothetical protein
VVIVSRQSSSGRAAHQRPGRLPLASRDRSRLHGAFLKMSPPIFLLIVRKPGRWMLGDLGQRRTLTHALRVAIQGLVLSRAANLPRKPPAIPAIPGDLRIVQRPRAKITAAPIMVARSVSLVNAIYNCGQYYPVDTALLERFDRAFNDVGEKVAAKEGENWRAILRADRTAPQRSGRDRAAGVVLLPA